MTIDDYFNDPERPGFLEWGQAVNKLALDAINMGVLDIADQDYSAMFEDDMTPEEAWADVAESEFGIGIDDDEEDYNW